MSDARTVVDWIDRFDPHSEREAVFEFGKENVQQRTYKQLDQHSRHFACGLNDKEVGRDDRVALLAPSSYDWIAACLGTIRAGAVPVPLDVQFDDEALVHALNDSQPRLIVTDAKQAKRLEQLDLDSSPRVVLLTEDEQDERSWHHLLADATIDLARAEPDDDAVLFYTSGTTGPPKGVPLTQEYCRTNRRVDQRQPC